MRSYCFHTALFLHFAAYGTNATDEREARKGPVFLVHPESIVVIAEDSRSDTEGEVFSIMLECFADGNPMPTYRILHTGSSGTRVITTDTDSRYTITGGRYIYSII